MSTLQEVFVEHHQPAASEDEVRRASFLSLRTVAGMTRVERRNIELNSVFILK